MLTPKNLRNFTSHSKTISDINLILSRAQKLASASLPYFAQQCKKIDGGTHSCLLSKGRQTALLCEQQSIMCRDPRVHNNGKWGRPKPILTLHVRESGCLKSLTLHPALGYITFLPICYMARRRSVRQWSLLSAAQLVEFNLPPPLPGFPSAPAALPTPRCRTVLVLFLTGLDNELSALHLKHRYLKWRPWSKRYCFKLNYVELY